MYKYENKFFKEFDSKSVFPFEIWYLNGEREHGEVDVVVERDVGAQILVKICGLYKF
jgi:hypothetical protein